MTISCPKCKEKHRIPEVLQDSAEPQRPAVLAAAAVESAVLSSAGGVCPDCSMLMPAGTVLCLACGYHTERGRRVGSEAGPTRSSEAGGVRGWLKSQLVEGEETEGANELIDSFSLLGMLTALSVVSGVLLVSFFLQKGMEGPAFSGILRRYVGCALDRRRTISGGPELYLAAVSGPADFLWNRRRAGMVWAEHRHAPLPDSGRDDDRGYASDGDRPAEE
jgi:hypothetical protein